MSLTRTRTALAALLLASLALAGCASAPQKDYAAFREADPRSILVVPPVNRTVDVAAPDYLLSTVVRPLAERGYYVFPIHMVKRVMEDDGLADADMVHNAPTPRLAELFGADAVLYVSVERWDAQYVVLNTAVTVDAVYTLKSGRDGATLWQTRQRRTYHSNQGSSGNPLADLIADAITAAIAAADPDYMPLARQASAGAVSLPGEGLPAGPYHEKYREDLEAF